MTESNVSQNANAVDTFMPGGAVSLESILCTEELHRRPSRLPDHEKENRALVALAQALADSPGTILQTLADTILEVLQCDSAGLSLLTTDDGGKRFYWPAIAGRWKPHIGGGTPRDFGPCGDVLDRNIPLLFRHLERRYTYFQPVTPPVEECLLVPFYVEGKAVGTIWAVAHDDRRKFDAEDMRQLVSLGRFASAAYQAVASTDAVKRLAAIVEFSDDAIISKNLDGVITSWNKSAERLFGYTAEETVGQHITLIIPPDRRDEETTILDRLRRGERMEHFETVRVRKDGRELDVSLTISPVKDATGRVIGASKVARDNTERKHAERALRESEERLRTLADGLETQVRARTQELKQRNAEILEQSERLRELSHRLMRAQDEERRHIARELHDSTGQDLTALKLELAALGQEVEKFSPELAGRISENAELTRHILDSLRTMSYLLHPPLLDELGLGSALRWYIEGFEKRSGIKTRLELGMNEERLAPQLEMAVFRLVQEGLTNIHRHSGSPTALVRLHHSAGHLVLEIQDEGKGMTQEQLSQITSGTTSSVGLQGMRERIKQFGGNFEIVSDNHGLQIKALIPLRSENLSARASASH